MSKLAACCATSPRSASKHRSRHRFTSASALPGVVTVKGCACICGLRLTRLDASSVPSCGNILHDWSHARAPSSPLKRRKSSGRQERKSAPTASKASQKDWKVNGVPTTAAMAARPAAAEPNFASRCCFSRTVQGTPWSDSGRADVSLLGINLLASKFGRRSSGAPGEHGPSRCVRSVRPQEGDCLDRCGGVEERDRGRRIDGDNVGTCPMQRRVEERPRASGSHGGRPRASGSLGGVHSRADGDRLRGR